MAAPTVTVSRSRWPYLVVAAAVVVAGLWWWRDGAHAGAGRDRGRGHRAGASQTRGATPFDVARRQWQRRRALGPIAVAPPAAGLIRVQGTVVDAGSGAPVPDVEVVFADGASEASATSDLAGRYSIDVPIGRYRPFVRADGILSVGRAERTRLPGPPRPDDIAASRLAIAPALAVDHDMTGVDLEVVRAGVVRGRVVDRRGVPVAGAVVRASGQGPRTLRPVLGTDVAETGPDGTFQLDLPAASYVVEAFHDDYGAVEVALTVALEPGEREEVDLTLVAGCVITGRVVRGGEPAGDGAIERAWSVDDPNGFFPAGEIADDGTFRWTTGETGDIVLRAWPWKSTHSDARRFACTDGARFRDVVFTIPDHGATLGGRIVTARGAPAAHAYVDINGLSAGTMNQQERADGDGNWEVFALPPGEYEVTAYVDGEGATTARLTSPSRGNTLTLGGTGTIAGTVDGITDGSFALSVVECVRDGSYVGAQARHLVTVRGGAFRLDGLPACDLVIEVGRATRRRRLGVHVDAGQVATVALDLRPARSKTIRGTVRGPDGQPTAANVLLVRPNSGDDLAGTAQAGDDGRFTIVAQGGDRLIVSRDDSSAVVIVGDDAPDPLTVDVTLEPVDDHW